MYQQFDNILEFVDTPVPLLC